MIPNTIRAVAKGGSPCPRLSAHCPWSAISAPAATDMLIGAVWISGKRRRETGRESWQLSRPCRNMRRIHQTCRGCATGYHWAIVLVRQLSLGLRHHTRPPRILRTAIRLDLTAFPSSMLIRCHARFPFAARCSGSNFARYSLYPSPADSL
jgi:hypothetical protein